MALTYHVTNPYDYIWGNQDSVESMRQKVQSMLRDIIGGMKLTDALDSNEKIQSELQKRIAAATDMYGLHVDQVNIEQLQASKEMQNHMDEQKRSQLDKVSKKNEADGDAAKIKATNDAQNQATVNTAKAQAKATERQADAQKYAIQKNADAKQYSVQVMQRVLKEIGNNPKLAAAYFNYLSINAYDDLAQSGNLVFSDGQSNHFGNIPKMAAMQKVWHKDDFLRDAFLLLTVKLNFLSFKNNNLLLSTFLRISRTF
ncbi:MAG: SPFH/Band 7/PHB domain protein [Acetilactobacillus jinshanensis]